MSDRRDDARWAAVLERDGRAAFLYGVRTTGIYCRPSCPSRRPKRENVAFYDSCKEAERAGLRACQRCQPEREEDDRSRRVREACRLIEESEEEPRLADLAHHAGLSPFHLQRLFKAVTGITPKAYAIAVRKRRMQTELGQASTVTEAIYRVGHGSSSRFYERATESLGMKPSELRAGAAGVRIRFAIAPCSLGLLLVAATDRGLCAISLGDDEPTLVRELRKRFPRAVICDFDPELAEWMAVVVALVEEPGSAASLPLDIRGTAFQERVWNALRRVPPGETIGYGELARRIGAPRASRAVARACAQNPLALAIPCHRVVRSGGELSGYRWGVERKRELLAREERKPR